MTSHYPELKEWASATEGVANAATGFDPETEEPLYRIALGRPGASHALRIAARLGLPSTLVEEARAHVAPERLRIAELLAEAETQRSERRQNGNRPPGRAGGGASRGRPQARVAELEAEIGRVRASAQAERERALAAAEQELAGTKAELDALRAEIRAARRLERERRRATTPKASPGARARPPARRRIGTSRTRGTRLAGGRRPVEITAPLAPGDPVIAPALGVRGTIAEIAARRPSVLGPGGLRVRVPVDAPPARSRRSGARGGRGSHGACARPRYDARELDLRGRTAQDAREAVRTFVDAAALAGRDELRVIHGRGTERSARPCATSSRGTRSSRPRARLSGRRHRGAPRLKPCLRRLVARVKNRLDADAATVVRLG